MNPEGPEIIPNTTIAAPVTTMQPTPTARTIDLLHKQKRVHKTGCTLSAANIQMLAENFVLLINHQMLENWQPLLNDRSDMSLVLREHDFEFFKAARSFVQSINSLKKMLDLRIEEINKLIEENRSLFDQWNKEYAEQVAAAEAAAEAAAAEKKADIVAGTELAAIPDIRMCEYVDCTIAGPHKHDSVGPSMEASNDTPPAPEAA